MIECRQHRCNAPGAEGVCFASIEIVSQAHVQDARNYCHTLGTDIGMSWDISVRWEFQSSNEGTRPIEDALQHNDLYAGTKPRHVFEFAAARIGVRVAAPDPGPSARLGINPA
jgi:hypothetical protein